MDVSIFFLSIHLLKKRNGVCFWGQFCASSKRSSTILDFFPSGFSKLCPAEVLTLHISGGKVGFRWSVVKKGLQFTSGSQLHFPAKNMPGDLNLQNVFFRFKRFTRPKTYMTLEKQPVEDVSPTKHGDVPLSILVFGGVTVIKQKQQCFFPATKVVPRWFVGRKNKKHWAEVRVEYHAGDSWIRTKSTKHVMSSWCMTGILGGGLDPISNVCQWMHLILLWNRIETNGCCQLIIDFCEWFSDFDECFSWWHFTPAFEAMKASLCAGGEETTWQKLRHSWNFDDFWLPPQKHQVCLKLGIDIVQTFPQLSWKQWQFLAESIYDPTSFSGPSECGLDFLMSNSPLRSP